MRRILLVLVAGTMTLPAVPFRFAQAAPVSSEVSALSGEQGNGELVLSGTARFGGQDPIQVADDPANDANLTPTISDRPGTEAGVDLLTASLSVPDPSAPELLVQWQVASLPANGMVPEGVRYSFPFKVGSTAYVVEARFSHVTDPELAGDPQAHANRLGGAFELRGNCTASVMGTGVAHCSHLAWLTGSVDAITGTISARVPIGSSSAPALTAGAVIQRNDSTNPDLNQIIAGYQLAASTPSTAVDDRASFGPGSAATFSFTLPQKAVTLGTAPPGTDPRDVTYATPAKLEPDGSFTGSVSTMGLAPGTFDVFARACFANNCGYRSLSGQSLAIGDLVAALSIPDPGEPDHSFVFWQGANIGDGGPYALHHSYFVGTPDVGSCTNSPCFTYKLRVDTPGAARLRVALDASMRSDGFLLQVTPPAGASKSRTNDNQFNSELFFDNPPVGIYTILVRPWSTRNSEFALRAKLEAQLPTRQPNENGLFPPNLRPTAPYEFGFAAPLNPLNGPFLAPDDFNPPAAVGGHGTVSCSADEMYDEEVVRCLRFSFGLSNTGPGNFDIRRVGSSNLTGLPAPLVQCVERQGGSPVSRPAGQTAFHPTHAHNHYDDLIEVELLRVTSEQSGAMVPAGEGRKLGYSPADQSLADWSSFNQNAIGTATTHGSCQAGATTLFSLSVGWGDVYRYQRAGNYVNFGTNPDGLYVVRLKIDPLGNVLEASETDNVSYTYIRVTLDTVQVLEHGRGLSPWDPNKQVLLLRRKGGVPW